MDFALQPHTEAGQRFVTLAEQHAVDFATRAAAHDRDGSFPFENITALQQSGVLAACVPEEFGGLGVTSVHDTIIGISRLGQGDGSTAIATTMHLTRPWWITRLWHRANTTGHTRLAEGIATLLRQVGSGQIVTCSLASEPGTDLLHPLTEATQTDAGWRINGQKSFGTMSPAAHLLEITCRVRDPRRGERLAQARVPRESAGLDIKNNWDALGMRASGSHDVTFTNCFISDTALVDVGPWGKWTEGVMVGLLAMTMGLVGVFLGIAEAARDLIVETVATRRKGPHNWRLAERYAIQHTITEIEIDLATSRAILERTATTADTFFGRHPAGSVPLEALHQLMKDFQCTKWVVTRKAIEIVDRALTVSGGAGCLSTHALSRLYRDVRAGPFMQLFSPNEAFEYIGKVTLGLDPSLDA